MGARRRDPWGRQRELGWQWAIGWRILVLMALIIVVLYLV